MTNLKAIGFTFVGGSCVGLACLIAFGLAVRRRHPNVAPRSIARPPESIFNPSPKYKAQERGNAFTGWILWTLTLSYPTMLRGVPGTGTRSGGMKGKLLDVNLDGIVLLRFHAVCLRVALLTAVLALGVVLPLNLTAQCYRELSLDPTCTDPENENEKLSDYERTTMANIPPLSSTSSYANDPKARERYLQSFTRPELAFIDTLTNAVWGGYPYVHILVRLYTIVLCSWLVFWYTCSTLKNEWKEALALRRVYYLENDLWQRRKKELEATIYNVDDSSDSSSDEDDDNNDGNVATRLKARVRARRRRRRQRERRRHRERATKDPWVPPAEQRETVPNIELYSVLVGELPRLPSEIAAGGDTESAMGISRAQAIDWQLAVVSTFFNHCVPNQPGFSSSVAAVTILPDAPSLARAWRMWFTAAAALRRLRFIRTLISERRYYEICDQSDSSDDEEEESEEGGAGKKGGTTKNLEMQLEPPPPPPSITTCLSPNRLSASSQGFHKSPQHQIMSPSLQQRVKGVPSSMVSHATETDNVEISRHDHKKHLSMYTENWWVQNQKSEDGQQFLHTFENTNGAGSAYPFQQTQPMLQADAGVGMDPNAELLKLSAPSITIDINSNAAPDPGMDLVTPTSSSIMGHQHFHAHHQQQQPTSYPPGSPTDLDPAERAKAALTYYREVFGSDDNLDVESHFFHALQFGPEQTAVYSRELAQGASSCCPNGCGEKRLRDRKKVGIDELIALEREAVIRVHNANVALQHAQARAAVSVLDTGVSEKEKDMATLEVETGDYGEGTPALDGSGTSTVPSPNEIERSWRPHTSSPSSKRNNNSNDEGAVAAHRRVKSWSPRKGLTSVMEVSNEGNESVAAASANTAFNPLRKAPDATPANSSSSHAGMLSSNRPPSIASQGRSMSAAVGGAVRSSSLTKEGVLSKSPDIMKLPNSLNREAHELVRAGLRPEPTLLHNANYTPPTSSTLRKGVSTTVAPPITVEMDMQAVGGGKLSPPPPRILVGARSQSVRFLDQAEGATQSPSVTVTKSAKTNTSTAPNVPTQSTQKVYQRRYFDRTTNKQPSAVLNAEAEQELAPAHPEPTSSIDRAQELSFVPSSIPSVSEFVNQTSLYNATTQTTTNTSMPPPTHSGPSRLRTMTSDSQNSNSSVTANLVASRFAGKMTLTSEGKLIRRAPHGQSYHGGGGASVCGNSTVASVATGFNMDAFDPYSVVKHKKNDGDNRSVADVQSVASRAEGNLLCDSTRSAGSTLSRRKNRSSNVSANNVGTTTSNNHTNSYLEDFEGLEPSDQWTKVEQICAAASENDAAPRLSLHDGASTGPWANIQTGSARSGFDNGVWDPHSVAENTKHSIKSMSTSCLQSAKQWAKQRTDSVVGEIQSNSTYAVVTFSNRQAAVAARHLLADGRGASRWQAIEKHPVPPLADSASCDLVTCRGCCRPLTLSVSDSEKLFRKILMYLLLFFIYVFYTLPITFAQSFIKPESLYEIFPIMEQWKDQPIFNQVLSGIVPAALLALFFALCPLLFKAIANSGAAATSVADAEGAALQYFWWFMLITAFSGSSIMTFVLNTLNEVKIGTTAAQVLLEIAKTVPTQVSATWLNWVILRFTCILPNQYLLQLNTFLFQGIGWNCCARASQGGGPGGCIPYRIYVDSGVVFMCTVSLSFACPLMAPAALAYYLVCSPLLRRNLIYIYRPRYDGGGLRWPFLFDVFISSMIVGQILLATMMVLKEAIGPCFLAALPIIPTLLYRTRMRNRFLRAYEDAGLLQTSLLDEWDSSVPTSTDQREEFRRFLVDAHKAAYIPVCIAGDATSVLTAEPAVVVPLDHDDVNYDEDEHELDEEQELTDHQFAQRHREIMMAAEHATLDESNNHVAQI